MKCHFCGKKIKPEEKTWLVKWYKLNRDCHENPDEENRICDVCYQLWTADGELLECASIYNCDLSRAVNLIIDEIRRTNGK